MVLFKLFFICSSAFAFDIYPEYQGLSESDLLKFETPLEIDSEYQTITNAYSYSAEWEREFQKAVKAFDLSVGSMSNKLFYQYGRVKLRAPLTDSLDFQFHGFSQRDREVDQVRHVLELSQRIFPGLRLNAYGEPSMFKRENDLGFALVLGEESWRHRFYYTFHDLTRAEHNDQADKFKSGQDPRSIGWVTVGEAGPFWLRLGARYDQPVKWVRPQESRIFRYDKKLAYLDARYALSESRRFTSRLQWDETFKGQDKDSSASLIVKEGWRLSRLFARFSFLEGSSEDIWGYELSVMHAQRRWEALTSELSHFNEMASVAFNFRGTRRGESFDRWRMEYEVGLFRRFGNVGLAPTQKHSPAEHRLQAAYEWSFQSKAQLRLALNFDADQWTPVPTFEGGQGMFRTEF